MGEFPRKADGRRIFSAEFKREVVQPRARAGPGAEDDGGGDPPCRPGDSKKKSVVAQRVRSVTGFRWRRSAGR